MAISPLPPEQEQALRELLRVFLEENKKLNLSAYRTEEQCWVGNVLDSLSAVAFLHSASRGRAPELPLQVMDVGTGGGFPLLPLAILLPEVRFTGLDATKKKVDAVQRMVEALKSQNVTVLAGRAEELGHRPELREQFDMVLSRAVATLSTLLEYCSPFVRVGGKVIAWKTLSIEEELQASVTARMQLHCRLMDRVQYDLDELAAVIGLPTVARRRTEECQPSLAQARLRPTTSCGGWGERQLLVFEKVKTLPREFPRKVGVPKKKPL